MVREAVRLRPGALVVLEGLDRTGKSSQATRLQQLRWADPAPKFTHMPSGLTELTQAVYRLTEDTTIASPLARQLLHLACHAENLGPLQQVRRERAVVLDRWWWSTVAYGWHASHLAEHGVDYELFHGLIGTVWAGQNADTVFLFTTPHKRDDHNRQEVREAYDLLAAEHPAQTVRVPATDPAATTEFIVAALRERGLLEQW
ncbi:hypothetical protein [Catenulispora subtropica]|uniref:Thymidylate kinase n=1 Tax=Catenulispora subtropica TaxID=450798 RepID=A0ABP5CIN5_9ACTN